MISIIRNSNKSPRNIAKVSGNCDCGSSHEIPSLFPENVIYMFKFHYSFCKSCKSLVHNLCIGKDDKKCVICIEKGMLECCIAKRLGICRGCNKVLKMYGYCDKCEPLNDYFIDCYDYIFCCECW